VTTFKEALELNKKNQEIIYENLGDLIKVTEKELQDHDVRIPYSFALPVECLGSIVEGLPWMGDGRL
jgi:hypothetical protein